MADQGDTFTETTTAVQPPEGQGEPTVETSAVQPEAGQGQQDTQDPGLYAEALASVPEEQRQFVEPHFKEWDRKVAEKLRDAAEYRKGWASYEELGVRDMAPEQVGALVEFAQALSDPDTAKEVIKELAREVGLELSDAEASAVVEDDGEPDPLAELRAELAELREFKEGFTREQREGQILAQLQEEMAAVQTLHGKPLTEKEQERLLSLAGGMFVASETPLKDAYAFVSEIAGDAEAGLVKTKQREPKPAEPAGRASTTPEPVDDFDVANALFAQRMKAA